MKNVTQYPVHALLEARWSPYSFDGSRSVQSEDLYSLFEAARWAMSAYNDQPWRYIVANRESDMALWEKILTGLVEGNRPWAKNAPVLALGLVNPNFEKTGKPNATAVHDLGAASALLTVEATARGLAVHQMSGIQPTVIQSTFPETEALLPVTALAIGYPGNNSQLDPDYAKRDSRDRQRKPQKEILLQAGF